MKTIIFQYESEIKHRIDDWDREMVLSAINMHLVGTNKMTMYVDEKIVENPVVTNHPNYSKVKEAHYKIFSTIPTKILVRVYDDGSHDIVPILKGT